ncbi:MAG: chromate resistance protein ChrB domain-containing protein [Thermomicrobiales bacterium]
MQWVTRVGVRLDRAAMIWMIRTFIDPQAAIALLPEGEVMAHAEQHGATPFHHPQAAIRHQGSRTGFDGLRVAYDVTDPAVALMSLVLRGAETSDRALTQWSPGIAAVTSGMRKRAESDEAFLAAVMPLLDGLYQWCQDQLANPGKARES